jgi:uncharacterized protein (DUF983 family)
MGSTTLTLPPPVIERPELRNLPPSGLARLRVLLARAFRRRCPECGGRGIFSSWFTMKSNCPSCGYQFARESGYFLGAYPLNLVAAEIGPIGLMVALLVWTDISWILLEAILIPLAVGMPLLLFPFACTVWMAIDLFFTPVNQR